MEAVTGTVVTSVAVNFRKALHLTCSDSFQEYWPDNNNPNMIHICILFDW